MCIVITAFWADRHVAVVNWSVVCAAEIGRRRMTRALKNQVQQQQVINLEAAMRILEQSTPPLVVDHSKLKVGV